MEWLWLSVKWQIIAQTKSRLHILEKAGIEQIMNNVSALPDSVLAFPNMGQWQKTKASQRDNFFTLGAKGVDARLQGGLPRAALHEIFAGKSDDVATASAFALLLALRLPEPKGKIFWIAEEKQDRVSGRLYPPGLADFGFDPAAMILVRTANLLDSLRAAADTSRSKAASAVIMEAHGGARMIDLTSTRRLSLAAANNGVLALLLRVDAMPVPSAASSRWQIRSAPSEALPVSAPGLPTFDISLLRHRGGLAPFEARVSWDHERQIFHDAPLSGGLSAAVPGRKADPDTHSHQGATA